MPPDPSLDMKALGEIGASMLGAKKVRPAVMAVAVHVGNRRNSALLLSSVGPGAGGQHIRASDLHSTVVSNRNSVDAHAVPPVPQDYTSANLAGTANQLGEPWGL